jgi:hypothetical protein
MPRFYAAIAVYAIAFETRSYLKIKGAGLEPASSRLRADCSTTELPCRSFYLIASILQAFMMFL